MANLITVSVLKYGNIEFGTTLADAKTMVLSTEHIIYGTNKETALGINATVATAATDALTITAHGLSNSEYIRVGDVGDAVGNFDIASSDFTPGKVFKMKATGADNVFLFGSETDFGGDTVLDITTGAAGLALPVYRVQGKILYSDPSLGSGTPIEIITVEPCVNVADGGLGVSAGSNQLKALDINKKNGVTYDINTQAATNLLINLDRVILAYESVNEGDDFNVYYDASNTNYAGMDSPFVDVLEVEKNLTDVLTHFLQHAGGKSGLVNMLSLVVNGQLVAFPDQAASGLVRLKNIASANEMSATTAFGWGSVQANETVVKLKRGFGKGGDDYLVVNHTAAQFIALTEAAATT